MAHDRSVNKVDTLHCNAITYRLKTTLKAIYTYNRGVFKVELQSRKGGKGWKGGKRRTWVCNQPFGKREPCYSTCSFLELCSNLLYFLVWKVTPGVSANPTDFWRVPTTQLFSEVIIPNNLHTIFGGNGEFSLKMNSLIWENW